MGYDAPILREDKVYKGKRKNLRFRLYADAALTVALDAAALSLAWKLASVPGGTALLTKTTPSGITVSGTFNATPSLNLQTIVVPLAAADSAGIAAGDYWHELARTDGGFEDVLADGRFTLRPALV